MESSLLSSLLPYDVRVRGYDATPHARPNELTYIMANITVSTDYMGVI